MIGFGFRDKPPLLNSDYALVQGDEETQFWYRMLHVDTKFFWMHPVIQQLYAGNSHNAKLDYVLTFKEVTYPFWDEDTL